MLFFHRPSRFPGTYVVADKKAINDKNNLIVHKAIHDMSDLTNDTRKKRKRIPKNRAPVQVRSVIKTFVLF